MRALRGRTKTETPSQFNTVMFASLDQVLGSKQRDAVEMRLLRAVSDYSITNHIRKE